MSKTALEKIADREQAVTTTIEQVKAQIDTRAKLKRLVSTGLVTADEPGLFTLPRPRPGD